MLESSQEWPKLFEAAFNKRPEEQLYDIHNDPGCLINIAGDPSYNKIKDELSLLLENELINQGDPRILGSGDIFDSYPRISSMRDYPGFRERGNYNPAFQ